MSSYSAYASPRWIAGISKYAHGCGTVVFKSDPNAYFPDGVVMKLREVLYVPGLRDHHGLPIGLFSNISA
jgi:hypothetical protein